MANSERPEIIDESGDKYKYGFVTDIEAETAPKGLNADIIRLISAKKGEPEWLLERRLKAFEFWQTMKEPSWAKLSYDKIDYQDLYYYSAPKRKAAPKSLDEVDKQLLETYDKLGIPLKEQEALAGVVAVDAVFDSVSVATTYRARLAEKGIIFCSISEAVKEHPELVKKYLGSVVPYTDNFFACLNSAVFTDGSFVYIPKGVRCPMELSTYFRINAKNTGQFERTLIIADEGSYVSYLEGCTAPQRDENQLHAAIVEIVVLDNAEVKYSTLPRRQFQSVVDAGGNRFGSHLEIPVLRIAGGQFGRRVLFGGADQQPPAGRYRHQNDPYRQKHHFQNHFQGHFRRFFRPDLPRAGQSGADRRQRPQLFAVRQPADRFDLRFSYRSLYRKPLPHRHS